MRRQKGNGVVSKKPNVTRKEFLGLETLLRNMSSLDPEYMSGGREAEGLEKKVIAVFEKEFALAIQEVDHPNCHTVGRLSKSPYKR